MIIFGCWWQNFYLCDIYWMMVPNAKLNRWSESWLFKWPEASPISLTCRWQLLINTFCRWQWCWWHRYVGDFFRYVGDFLYVLNRSPTSQTCHQQISLNPIPTQTNPKSTQSPIQGHFKWKNFTHCEKISVNKMFTVSLFCLLSSTWPDKSLCWWRVIRLLRWRLAAVGSKEWTSPGH